ncbi:hypothetical protein LZ30DRAFT_699352 [Colletotrichum cereale]|nr:hypothetical protein LZ30DRAFT_699352 [Colletotrichum cereale]
MASVNSISIRAVAFSCQPASVPTFQQAPQRQRNNLTLQPSNIVNTNTTAIMKTSSILAAAGALFTSASAQLAIVENHCTSTFYVQSFPYDGSAPGPLTTVTPGQKFSESFRPSGSTVKISTLKTLDSPLFFGYSFSSNPDYAYYELSSQWGNPFISSRNTLGAGAGCQSFNCAPNDANCYSTPAMKRVYGCPQPVNLTAGLCV